MNTPVEPELPTVWLKSPRRFLHPWIFQRLVERPNQRIPNGALVRVVDPEGRFMGSGIYNGHSRIAVRILSNNEAEPLNDAFFEKRINTAVSLRRELLKLDACTDAYRVINSEADGMSGLIVDRFNDLLVLEFFSVGMYRLKDRLIPLLLKHFPESRIYWFAEEHVQKQESFDCRPPAVTGPCVVTENGLKFRVQPGFKHKTGFFADQRDNRRRVAGFCEGKRVLDICCNSGGFAVYAASALGKAKEVIGLDLDEVALELARQNAGLNQSRPRWVQADLFPWLRDVIAQKNLFDVVILDPSKQTRDRDEIDLALRRYFDMNRLALQVVQEGGILVSCSCTGLISEADFLECIRRASRAAGRATQVLAIHGAASDHPYQLQVPEGRYLKVVFLRVMEAGEPMAAPEQRHQEPEE